MIRTKKIWQIFAGTVAAAVTIVGMAQPISDLPDMGTAIVAEAYDVGYYVTTRTTGASVYREASTSSSRLGAAQTYECFHVEEINGNWGRTNSIYVLRNDSVVCVSGWVNLDLTTTIAVDDALGIPYPRPTGSPILAKNTQAADNHGHVAWVQTALNKMIHAGLTTDGRYGDATVNKVKEFQSAYGLTADGQVGAKTVAKMVEVLESMAVVYPSKPAVSVSAGTNRTNTVFSWNACSDADWYDIRIYDTNNNCISQNMNYNGTSYALVLEAGTYSVDVASVNAKGTWTFSDRVGFTVNAETTTTTTTSTTPVTTTTVTTNNYTNNAFDFDADIWNFPNTSKVFAPAYISESYWQKLIKNIPNTDIAEVTSLKKQLYTKFDGVCYGMSVLTALYKQGYLHPADYTEGAATLKQIGKPNDDDIESLIVYYYLLQGTTDIKFQTKKCLQSSKYSMKNMMNTLIQKAGQVSDGGAPVVVNYAWTESGTSGWAHSVVAYGVEYGYWDVGNGYTDGYDGRILVYDCSKGRFTDDACIYFKTDTLEWCVPYKKLKYNISDSKCYARLLMVSNDAGILNKHGYLKSPNLSVNTGENETEEGFYPEIAVNSQDISIRKTGSQDTFAINSSEMDEDEIFNGYGIIAGEANQGYSYFMTDHESGYSAMANVDEEMSVTMRFENERAVVNADHAHRITFLPDCTVSINGDQTDYDIDVVTNQEQCTLPWYELQLEGDTDTSVSLQQYRDGYLLKGDLGNTLRVTANNTVGGQCVSCSDLGTYSSVYITTTGEYSEMLNVLVDKDRDGTYETSILDRIPGDVNADGVVNVLDLMLAKRQVLTGNCIVNLYGMDKDSSGTVTLTDLVSLQKFLLNR